jgi:hypothetical protein
MVLQYGWRAHTLILRRIVRKSYPPSLPSLPLSEVLGTSSFFSTPRLWRERNRHAVRAFWARAAADTLGVKHGDCLTYGPGHYETWAVPRTHGAAKKIAGYKKSQHKYDDLNTSLGRFIKLADSGARTGSLCGVGPSPNRGYYLVCYKNDKTAAADRTAKLPARAKKPPRLVVWVTVQLRRLLLPGRHGGATAGRHGGSCIATRIFAARNTHRLERVVLKGN